MTSTSASSTALRRRSFLGLAGGGALAGALPAPIGHAAPGDNPYAVIRQRQIDRTCPPGLDPDDPLVARSLAAVTASSDRFRSHLIAYPARTQVFDDLEFGRSSGVANSCARLVAMAKAYRMEYLDSFRDPALLQDILDGIRTIETVYHSEAEEYDNWYHWEIAAPEYLLVTCVLLEDDLPADMKDRLIDAVDHFNSDPGLQWEVFNRDQSQRSPVPSTGSNLTELCRNVILRAALGEDEAPMLLAANRIGPAFTYAELTFEEGEGSRNLGFYPDGSYIYQTHVAQTGSYGVEHLASLSLVVSLLGDGPWSDDVSNMEHVLDSLTNCFAPWIENGYMMDAVRGRGITRTGPTTAGHTVIGLILELADASGDPRAGEWRSLCKGWLTRHPRPQDVAASWPLSRIALFQALMSDDSAAAAPPRNETRIFPRMGRAVHRRDGWAYAIALSSERTAHYEYGNGNNYRGWHTGSGMTYLHVPGDHSQYDDAFWPTVDLYRLPGTTVDTQQLGRGAGGAGWGHTTPANTWAGGANLGQRYGAVGLDLRGLASTMRAHKSWFCLDEGVVALGSDIRGGTGHPVVTTVEQRLIHDTGSGLLLADGEPVVGDLGSVSQLTPGWTHLDGTGGIVFLGEHTVTASRTARTGSWRQVDDAGADTPITREYVALAIDHGVGRERSVTVSTADDGYVETGTWRDSSLPGLDGGKSRYATVAGSSATWTAQLPEPDLHRVEVWYPRTSSSTRQATYVVRHVDADGAPVETSVTISQREGAGDWASLGEFRCGPSSSVTLVSGEVVSDAYWRAGPVRWTQLTDAPPPPDGSYGYFVLPTASPAQTEDIATASPVDVLAHDETAHGIAVPGRGLTMINFFAAGTVGAITADGPCSVVVETGRAALTVAVADPTQHRDVLSLTLACGRWGKVDGGAVTGSEQSGRTLRLDLDVSARDGVSHEIRLTR